MNGPNDMKFFTDLVKQTTTISVHRNLSGRYPNANRAMRTIEKGMEMVQDLDARGSVNTMSIPGGGSISVPVSQPVQAAPEPAPAPKLDEDRIVSLISKTIDDKLKDYTPPK